MSGSRRVARRIATAAVGTGLVAGSVLALTSPAQAYSPNPDVNTIRLSTNSSHQLDDPVDGTYFKKDTGGTAVKIELRHQGKYVGKIEFHPYGELLYIYDTRADGDSFYVKVQSPHAEMLRLNPMMGSNGLLVKNLSYGEGDPVYLTVYDSTYDRDQIAVATGIA
ncbi:hypothetical protein FOE78_09900 [Microlunatus elymi]|uniref:DUF4384 domain-containing protein n=1 Tax=Microlunatus elymi TaxID=2596828 RepID=A0A516PYD1_9ACTN|nr:hypothetical protein [Microlunatus elymi]QDP96174.1 hypothetical protein FOE78_09900 [Microlunatus elymi]